MFRWLTRYVKKITVWGVGIEFREIPESEALPLLKSQATETDSAAPSKSDLPPQPLIKRQEIICISGCSASSQRVPRELDLRMDGEDIEFHVHQPGGSQPRIWIRREDLQHALDRWPGPKPSSEPIEIEGRTARKEAKVVVIVDQDEEAEVQAGWWIWVSRQDLKGALEALGLRVPW